MPVNLIPLVCHTCGRTYLVHPYRLGASRFCSRRCTGKSPKPARRRAAEVRFWEKVQKTESCWLWTASTAIKGHGHLRIDGALVGAHRFSWELHHGPIPDGLFVCHTCDNPPCVNPAHLFLGTSADNATDMVAKGRGKSARGAEHYHTTFTEETVRLIRARAAAGETNRALAAEFGVSRHGIYAIVHRKSWKHVL